MYSSGSGLFHSAQFLRFIRLVFISSSFALLSGSPSCDVSIMADSAIPQTVAHQVPLFMEFSRPKYQSGLPFSPPGDLPHPGIEPESPALQADSLPIELPGNSQVKKKESLAGRISKGPSSFNNVVTILILSLQSKCVSLSPRLELRITVSVCSVNK